MSAATFLKLAGLDKSFGDLKVLHEIDLEVAEGEMLALLGPSGSGKTTLLRLLAGFEQVDAGRILVAGEDVTRQSAARRGFGMVFQHYALFPHLSVGENVAFGLETRRWDKARAARRVEEMLELVDLPGFGKRRLGEVSGGQQQRVALARALAPEPRLLLLDEPLSNLDPSLRERTRRQLRSTVQQVGITTVLVTHEQEEAFDLGDRVAVLHGGVLQQVGRAEELYEKPATCFAASFVGRASALPGTLEDAAAEGAAGRVRLDGAAGATWEGVAAEPAAAGAAVELLLRPESLAFATPAAGAGLTGTVTERRYAGPVTYYRVALERPAAEVEVLAGASAAEVGAAVAVVPDPSGPRPRIFLAKKGP